MVEEDFLCVVLFIGIDIKENLFGNVYIVGQIIRDNDMIDIVIWRSFSIIYYIQVVIVIYICQFEVLYCNSCIWDG